MTAAQDRRGLLLQKIVGYAAEHGITGKSLREIGVGVGTSHRMLLYHFGSREGLMTAIVGVIEEQQRTAMAALATEAAAPGDLMRDLWERVSSPQARPFIRLFFEVFGQAVQGVAGTESMLDGLTGSWLRDGAAAAAALGREVDPSAMRLAVAATRGLLLDLLAGEDPEQVAVAYQLLVESFERWSASPRSVES